MSLEPLRRALSRIAGALLPLALIATPALAQGQAMPPLPGLTMPPADRAWTVADFSAASTALLLRQNFLPHASEADFGPRFAKLVSPATLKEIHRPDAAIEQRMNDANAVLQAVRSALGTYAKAGADYLPETMRLVAMMLDTSAYMVPLTDEFMAAMPRDDKYAVRANGVEQVRRGIGQMALGAAQTIGEQKSAEHQVLLAQALARTLPVLRKAMAPEALEAVRKQLAALVTLHSDEAREAVRRAQQAAA